MVKQTAQVDEKQLLLQLKQDDHRAFRSIYDRYSNNIYKYALHLLKSEELAQENVQETFLKLWNIRAQVNDILHLEGYLVTISRNRALDQLRKTKLTLRSETKIKADWVEGHNQTEEQIVLDDTRRVLQKGIDLLPPQQKLVYELCHLQGLKYEQAATQLGISTNTVKLYMKLSLKFLRDYLSKHTDVVAILIIFKLL